MQNSRVRASFAALLLSAFAAAGCLQNLSPADLSDSGITARLKSEIQAHPEIDASHLSIDTHVGMVTISGLVGTLEEKEALSRIARRLRGVKQLIVNVVVRQ